jgi:Ras-related protein Rab-21
MSKGASAGGAPQFRFKIVVLGEGCVGKTSLILRYTKNEFTDTRTATLKASFLSKRIVDKDSNRITLDLWDTAGKRAQPTLSVFSAP